MSSANKSDGLDFSIPKHINRRIDLPPEAYAPHNNECKYAFPKRPGFNVRDPEANIYVNQFRVQSCTGVDVYQYDVSLSPIPTHEVVYKKIWATKTVQNALKSKGNAPWLHDGVKLAWSSSNVSGRIVVDVDLGAEQGGTPGRPNQQFTLTVRQTSKIRLEVLRQYLQGQYDWDTNVLECMNCLDHILRQGPSENFKLIKRTLFHEGADSVRLGSFVEAVKGAYSAMRMTESLQSGGIGLSINVDVSNQSFWIGQKMDQVIRNFLSNTNRQLQNVQTGDLYRFLAPVKQGQTWVQSEAFKQLKRLCRLRFVTTHNKDDQREYTIFKFTFDKELGAQGSNAKSTKFEKKDENGNKRSISIFDYYLERHKCKIQHWQLPLIQTGKGGLFPIETCEVRRLNPYPFKLDPSQTQEMIKFAVQRPPQRKEGIMRAVALMNWGKDRYLNAFGMKINPTMSAVKARIIKNPDMTFKNKKLNPGVSGRWDLRGYQFAEPNPAPLNSWGVICYPGGIDKAAAANFVKGFINAYKSHGGKIANEPIIIEPPRVTDAQIIQVSYEKIGNNFRANPQIMLVILGNRDTGTYESLKRQADCYTGIVTQMLLANNARKCAPQYCSNLAMKVNAKLGGQTANTIVPPMPKNTAMIGVDVSHASPGVEKASMASMCMSMDKNAAYYQGRVETNGWRVEILHPKGVANMLEPMLRAWTTKNKAFPENLFYFRDGVAEGQFIHVLEHEIKAVKAVLDKVHQEKRKTPAPTKITVIIATKRHHIRFFPERGDRNGNPLPGTLVDKEVTHPFQYDFYLCSHVAIQGTARPVHYTVIRDDIKMKHEDLQKMIYHQCYQYCRSTTPVSLHPAVYYAHLAGNRGRPHESAPGARTESRAGQTATSKNKPDPSPVVGLASDGKNDFTKAMFTSGMWYV
ncbi:ribonuclease H-like domain-containing protein [Cercophora newfieldiana]|uniref:Ribonuclease H-like domain-containing protein n=1 Tax=Cercophora newfieldiana TaxID=92897 RepID=A0AA39YEC0_9PEZI|nr:ribonuclease H-like domain-containing protein [Cercophora newfieldiana]